MANAHSRLHIGIICLCLVLWDSDQSTLGAPAEDNPLILPAPGYHRLSILTPTMLELTWVNTKQPDPKRVENWDLVDASGHFQSPPAGQFQVMSGGRPVEVQRVGFKRRVLYAPLKQRDLRIGNYLYLQLARPLGDREVVEVKDTTAKLWPASVQFTATAEPRRYSPVIHVNQVGYVPDWSKKAMIGFYLGNLGELNLPATLDFSLIHTDDGKEVFRGHCLPRPDQGYTFPCYQAVMEADFSEFKEPGEYRLVVSGLGESFPFFIDDGVAAAYARAYALGLYHQRCGAANELPFTRFTHAPCHLAPAEVPTMAFTETQRFLAQETENALKNPRHTAPPLKDVASSRYPFVRAGKIDVSGGHHDAGDYSKYTINSAALIHHLVFAVDVFPGVGELDNLGLPESGDGRSDLLQEAKWEADFLAKMQDDDGGFYFLVYPRNRRYENNVLPDHGDPQIVWPKTTSVTAAAVAALAQTASSPLFKKQFPDAARLYLDKAGKGWAFLERAINQYGRDGAYQKITHYGDEFMHDDELAWAACEMFLATGEDKFHRQLLAGFNPADPATRRWTWWRLSECYGRAIRSYAFAAKAGKIKREKLDAGFLARCEDEIIKCGEDQLRRARQSAYGTSFPAETKRVRSAGWYFSSDEAFDLAVACQLDYPERNDPRPKFREALLTNLGYEAGCNPVNVCYLTGLGWKRQREIVHQYAQNDWRVLPPSGIPLGNLQSGFGWMDTYKQELGALSFPADGANENPYPFYDRWGDSFNLQTEFVITDQARALATAAFLMAQTSLKTQPWKPKLAQIAMESEKSEPNGTRCVAHLMDMKELGSPMSRARIVWELRGAEPAIGPSFSFALTNGGPWVLEAEAQWPDGRRVFAVTNITRLPPAGYARGAGKPSK